MIAPVELQNRHQYANLPYRMKRRIYLAVVSEPAPRRHKDSALSSCLPMGLSSSSRPSSNFDSRSCRETDETNLFATAVATILPRLSLVLIFAVNKHDTIGRTHGGRTPRKTAKPLAVLMASTAEIVTYSSLAPSTPYDSTAAIWDVAI